MSNKISNLESPVQVDEGPPSLLEVVCKHKPV